jgi:ubiquinone/menaquinone biosynthesis C-methylase UbiE
MTNPETTDLCAITKAQQRVWSTGDFARIGATLVIVAERLAESANVRGGERVLDVACGAGNGAIAAARRTWTQTAGLDYVPELLDRGRERAAAEQLDVEFVEGDAQQMPFEDASFDVVMSIFGAMFAPDQQRTADELLRVCRPGGRIAMANWIPEGFVFEMFKTNVKHAPPPSGLASPTLWGIEAHVRKLFGDRVSDVRAERRTVSQCFRSPEHFIEAHRTWFGPLRSAYERVGAGGEEALSRDLHELLQRFNVDDRSLVLAHPYLELVAVKTPMP